MKKLLCSLLLLSLSGCTALGKLSNLITPSASPIAQAAIDFAVATAVGTNPLTEKPKALAIKTIATLIAADASNPATTIASLESELNARVMALAPSSADRASFMILTATLEAALNKQIQKLPQGPITSKTSVAIVGVANAVILATSYYGA